MENEREKELRKAQNHRAYEKRKARKEGFQPTEKDYEEKAKIEKERNREPLGVDGYLTVFRPSQRESGFGENKNAGFLICLKHGCALEKNGVCPMCARGCD